MSLINFFKKYLPKLCNNLINEGYLKAKEDYEKKEKLLKQVNDDYFFSQFSIGSFVIGIPNEESNIVIGKIIDYSFFNENSKPFLVVFDYVSNTELTLMSVVKKYNLDLIHAIIKMTPQERHVVFYGSNKSFAQKEYVIQDINELNSLLEKNNFFKDFKN